MGALLPLSSFLGSTDDVFFVPTCLRQISARSEVDGRSGATRSHAQAPSSGAEHGEDGEHRTFREASTLICFSQVGRMVPRGMPAGAEIRRFWRGLVRFGYQPTKNPLNVLSGQIWALALPPAPHAKLIGRLGVHRPFKPGVFMSHACLPVCSGRQGESMLAVPANSDRYPARRAAQDSQSRIARCRLGRVAALRETRELGTYPQASLC
jgi:hypothetical protein